jgi:hypothetical protein
MLPRIYPRGNRLDYASGCPESSNGKCPFLEILEVVSKFVR